MVWTTLAALTAYAGLGIAVAVAFVIWGLERVDKATAKAGWGFRLMILPGCVGLWPVVLARWLAGRGR